MLRPLANIIGLDLTKVAVDGCQHKAPCGGEGTGPDPTDRAKLGWKWSIASERNGIPTEWATDGANRGLLAGIETLHLDRGYDIGPVAALCHRLGIDDLSAPASASPAIGPKEKEKKKLSLGMRWPVERSDSWFTTFVQLRRNTDRSNGHCLARIALAVTRLITA